MSLRYTHDLMAARQNSLRSTTKQRRNERARRRRLRKPYTRRSRRIRRIRRIRCMGCTNYLTTRDVADKNYLLCDTCEEEINETDDDGFIETPPPTPPRDGTGYLSEDYYVNGYLPDEKPSPWDPTVRLQTPPREPVVAVCPGAPRRPRHLPAHPPRPNYTSQSRARKRLHWYAVALPDQQITEALRKVTEIFYGSFGY